MFTTTKSVRDESGEGWKKKKRKFMVDRRDREDSKGKQESFQEKLTKKCGGTSNKGKEKEIHKLHR